MRPEIEYKVLVRPSLTTTLTATTLTATAVAAMLLTGATASAGQDVSRPHQGASLAVVEHAVTDTTTDTGAQGDSVGDVLSFANPLFNASNRNRVGSDNGFCVRTKVGAAYECTWTNIVRGGSLTVSGPFYDSRDSFMAIIGGTGRYAGARGEMRLHARNAAGSAYDFTFHVIS